MTERVARLLSGIMPRRRNNGIYIPLPRELWRKIEGGCACQYCSADSRHSSGPAYWDTLAVSQTPTRRDDGADVTVIVHAPQYHHTAKKREEE